MKKYTITFTWPQAICWAISWGVGIAVGKFIYERIVG